MELNTEQLELSKRLDSFIKSYPNGFFGVLGAGGTGKTFAVCNALDVNKVIFLGATNKVCANLRDNLNKKFGQSGFKVKTIDSFFNFRMSKDENNKTVITTKIPDESQIPKIIVIDEVSLINERTYDLLMQLKDIRKIILIGDDMQIPPIEDEDKKLRNKDGFHVSKVFLGLDLTYTLTIQMRQKEGSGMFSFISKFRDNMCDDFDLLEKAERHKNGNDILLLDINSNELKDIIKNDNPIAVCYKNITVLSYNYKAGRELMGKDYSVNTLNKGDVVFFDSFYKDKDNCFYTSDVVTIVDVRENIEDKHNFFKDHKSTYTYDKAIIIDSDGGSYEVNISNGEKTLRNVRELKNNLVRNSNDKKEIAKLHTLYHDFKLGFAKLKKPYAITSHKAQGSTFGTVIIPLYDFANKYVKDRNQLFYVAISRAKDKLVFVSAPSNFKNTSDRYTFFEIERCGIASAQDWKCKSCGCEINDRDYDIDHIRPIKPRWKGDEAGRNDLGNLQALCKPCHKIKTYQI